MPHRSINESSDFELVPNPNPSYPQLFVGTAGWSISKVNADYYPPIGTHLRRYASSLHATEINSSFKKNISQQLIIDGARLFLKDFTFL